jgi:hypothetical protein
MGDGGRTRVTAGLGVGRRRDGPPGGGASLFEEFSGVAGAAGVGGSGVGFWPPAGAASLFAEFSGAARAGGWGSGIGFWPPAGVASLFSEFSGVAGLAGLGSRGGFWPPAGAASPFRDFSAICGVCVAVLGSEDGPWAGDGWAVLQSPFVGWPTGRSPTVEIDRTRINKTSSVLVFPTETARITGFRCTVGT